MAKRTPKLPVRRRVFLDRAALMWALNAMKDDKFSVEQRGAMSPEWAAKYDKAEKHLLELVAATERRS